MNFSVIYVPKFIVLDFFFPLFDALKQIETCVSSQVADKHRKILRILSHGPVGNGFSMVLFIARSREQWTLRQMGRKT